jgi:hypothetical protein
MIWGTFGVKYIRRGSIQDTSQVNTKIKYIQGFMSGALILLPRVK